MAKSYGQITSGALQRRLAKKAGSMGGRTHNKLPLSPSNGQRAGSMLKAGKPEGGRGKVSSRLAKGLG